MVVKDARNLGQCSKGGVDLDPSHDSSGARLASAVYVSVILPSFLFRLSSCPQLAMLALKKASRRRRGRCPDCFCGPGPTVLCLPGSGVDRCSALDKPRAAPQSSAGVGILDPSVPE